MKKSILFAFFALIFSVSSAQTPLTVAVDFTADDVEGNTHHLFEYLDAGKYVVLDFYFTTCTSCQGATPTINQSYMDFGCNTNNVIFIGINNGNSISEVLAYEATYGATYPSIAGLSGGTAITDDYGVSAFPTIIMIAPNHDIIEQDIWPVDPLTDVVEGHGGILSPCGSTVFTADFVGIPTVIMAGGSVDFSDNTQNGTPISWTWSFPGGVPATSIVQNPTGIVYANPGSYNVTLTVSDGTQTSTTTKNLYITVVDPNNAPEADFIANYTVVQVTNAVNFYNLSTGYYDSLLWQFPGGLPTESSIANPTGIIYNTIGEYDATLILYSPLGNDTLIKPLYIQVIDASFADTLSADFSTVGGRLIVQGWSVGFEDLSIGYPSSWQWEFQGGTPATSSIQNPQNITYSTPGIYDVKLIISNGLSTDTLFKDDYIVVTTEPWPDPDGYCEDTVTNIRSNERPLTFRHLTPSKWGYFPGHNEYLVKAYAEKFTFYTYTNVHGLIVPVVKAYGASSTAKVRFTVWDVDANGKPGAEIEKKDVFINTFTPYFYHVVMFDHPAPVNGQFFIGYQIYYNNPADTFVVYMSPNRGVGGNNSLYVKKGANWITPSALLNDTLNTSLAIRVLGCLYNELPAINLDESLTIYPNPTNGKTYLQIDENVVLQYFESYIFDISGRMLAQPVSKEGNGLYSIDLNNVAPGIYFVTVIANQEKTTRKVVVY
ncbi:MAG: hypothetical protein CVU05_05290 [Bacteroidetes bacterium HGW-Bacteroidetes-21]|nr:MAG: hypothetical protein CVU05_05290 [Bacteroidetes bacterium HGW-Bacteroidetes-21]